MAKRRKTRYQWLQNNGTIGPAADTEDTTNGRDFGVLAVPANGTTIVAIVDLLEDEAAEDQVGLPIGVTAWNSYVIKRIVGKFFVQATQEETGTSFAFLVGAGLFVARANDADSATDQPIGANTVGNVIDNYSPLRSETITEPWIWRRTWLLSNQLVAGGQAIWPRCTADYGSVADGPHIDAKVGRRVGNDERLWAVLAARSYPVASAPTSPGEIRGYIDYRVLGAPRRTHGRSAF